MTTVRLPKPEIRDQASLSDALRHRRSVRAYSGRSLSLQQVGQLLWAAQGRNDPSGLRTAPSAGALYPLELLVAAGDVTGLDPGVYRYRPQQHTLEMLHAGDRRERLAGAALGQHWVADSAAVLIITALYERTTRKYGERGKRYVHIEVGHAAQNALLQAASLGLGAAVVGAFDDSALASLLDLPTPEQPLYLLPVGWPANNHSEP
jgi:SagB-type dehydrogenase family enzyme